VARSAKERSNLMMRRRPLLRTAAIGGAGYLAGKNAAKNAQPNIPAPAPQPAAAAPGPPPAADRLEQLKQLGELHQAGVLTEEEFQKEKQRILTGG